MFVLNKALRLKAAASSQLLAVWLSPALVTRSWRLQVRETCVICSCFLFVEDDLTSREPLLARDRLKCERYPPTSTSTIDIST
ncbi:hypothetical protein EPR50_G00179770 [Perca flavescens]|uniref:Uncharacterized protein n=1 Tax=Perca flavescens TaxID=8167 RepID=A0A484CBX0_PERFV|nr:hypothetical protein EPR50_G00179770 [Perca flavescens]